MFRSISRLLTINGNNNAKNLFSSNFGKNNGNGFQFQQLTKPNFSTNTKSSSSSNDSSDPRSAWRKFQANPNQQTSSSSTTQNNKKPIPRNLKISFALNGLLLIVSAMLYFDAMERRKKLKATVLSEAQRLLTEERTRTDQRDQLVKQAVVEQISRKLNLNEKQKEEVKSTVQEVLETYARASTLPSNK